MHFNNVIGVPQFAIPKLGYVSDFVQNPPGMYIAIAFGAVLVVVVFLPDFLKKKEKVTATPVDTSTQEENLRLKEELEALKAKLEEKEDRENPDN